MYASGSQKLLCRSEQLFLWKVGVSESTTWDIRLAVNDRVDRCLESLKIWETRNSGCAGAALHVADRGCYPSPFFVTRSASARINDIRGAAEYAMLRTQSQWRGTDESLSKTRLPDSEKRLLLQR